MKIKSISGLNFKGRSFSHELSAVNLIVGDSFSGKTAVLDAITVGLLGYHPDLGKRVSDTGDLLGSGESTVTVALDNGSSITRKFVVKDGKVSDKTEGNSAPVVPVVLLSLRDWFSLTEQQRTQYIFDRSAASGEPKELLNQISELSAKYPAQIVDELVNTVQGSIDISEQNNEKFQDWMNGLIVTLKAKAQTKKDEVNKAGAVLRALKVGDKPLDRSAELSAAQKAVFDAQSVVDSIVKAQAQAKERADLAALAGYATEIEQQIADAKAKLGETPQIIDFKTQGDAMNAEITRLTDLMRQIERDRDAITDELTKRTNEYDKLMAGEDCPMCGTEGDTWKRRYAKQYDEVRQSLHERDGNLSVAFSGAGKSIADQKSKLTEARGAWKIQKDSEVWRSAEETKLKSLTERLGLAREAAAKLSGMPEVPKVDSESASVALSLVKGQFNIICTQQKAFDQWTVDKQRHKEADKALRALGAGQEVCREATDMAQAFRQKIVDSVFGSFISVARKLTDGILVGDLEYRDGEIGRNVNGRFVSHRTFSGTEKAITYAGLSVSLAQDSPCKLVLIDEMGIMDDRAKEKVLRRMVALTNDGVIDQACMCDVRLCGNVPGVREIPIE